MVARVTSRFTVKQGQYLAFLYYYTKLHGRAPAESELQQYFKVTAPSVHQMILTLEAHGLISREPGRPRSIRLLLSRGELPDLECVSNRHLELTAARCLRLAAKMQCV